MAAIEKLFYTKRLFLSVYSLLRSRHFSTFSIAHELSVCCRGSFPCVNLFSRRSIGTCSWSSSRQDELTKALSDAEKIVGYPTSFLNLRYLLSDEISNIAMYMKRFAMSKHPLVRTARGFVTDENQTIQTRGLLVLLISKASRPCLESDHYVTDQELVADIYSSQRQLADITETIHTGKNVNILFYFTFMILLLVFTNKYFKGLFTRREGYPFARITLACRFKVSLVALQV